MALEAIGEAHIANSDSQLKRDVFTAFSVVQVGRSPPPKGRKELHLHEKHSDVPASKRLPIVVGHGSCGLQKISL